MLCRDGTQSKKFKDESSCRYEVLLQRYYCPCCGERYIERPDCFMKGKQYLKSVIVRIRTGDRDFEREAQCDPATIFRWKRGI